MEYVLWAIGVAATVLVGWLFWFLPRRDRKKETSAIPPPVLRLEQIGGIGSSQAPSQYVKMKFQLVNEGDGPAKSWQVAIDRASSGVTLARCPLRGQLKVAPTIEWHDDNLPAGQLRELEDWFWVAAPEAVREVELRVVIRAEGMAPDDRLMTVTLPSGGTPAIRFSVTGSTTLTP